MGACSNYNKKAGNIRVIAVGDDDQNIYGFRGSSNKNMIFLRKYKATEFSLIKNYRSSSLIVQFNNNYSIKYQTD